MEDGSLCPIEMYQRDIDKIPDLISREQFVITVFEIGKRSHHAYDNIVGAVQMGDSYCKEGNYYSKELAYVTTIIMAKLNEDDGFDDIKQAIYELDNSYVRKLEIQLCVKFGYHYKPYNIMSLLTGIVLHNSYETCKDRFAPIFYDFCFGICLRQSILETNPCTILLAMKMLHRRKRLHCVATYKSRIFYTILFKAAREYEIPFSDMVKAYITTKS
jgi:hypothetical protein